MKAVFLSEGSLKIIRPCLGAVNHASIFMNHVTFSVVVSFIFVLKYFDTSELIIKEMKKYIILLIFFVFTAFLTSSCMATLSPESSYGTDATYRNNYNRNNYNNRGRFNRDRDRRHDRYRDRQRDGERDVNGTLIIRY